MQEDEANKNAHLLVYAAVVYLTLFLYTRQREVYCCFFILARYFQHRVADDSETKAHAFSVSLHFQLFRVLVAQLKFLFNNMKRIFYSVIVAALGTVMFSSCSNDDVVGADKTVNYQANFEKVFGQLNPNQNFNTQKTVTIESSLANAKGNYTLRVYDAVPTRKGASLIGKFENLNAGSTSTLKVDVNKATKNIYCIADNGESHQVVTTPLTASNRVSAKFDATGAPTNEPTYNDDQVTAITVAFEDLGSTDDFDFNDAVIKVEYATGTGVANVTLMAVGAVLPLKLYYVGGSNEAEPLFGGQELHSVMGYDQSIMINTNWKGHDKVPFVTCEIEVPEDFTIGEDGAPFLLEVDGEQGQRQITASTEYGAVPQVLVTGKYHSDEAKATYYWRWPKERVRLNVAYPGLSAWLADPTDLSFIAAGTTSKLYDGYDPTKEDEEEPEPPVVYEDLAISASSLELKEGEVGKVDILSGNNDYSATCDDESIAIVEIIDGTVNITAVAPGSTVITVIDAATDQTATIVATISKDFTGYIINPTFDEIGNFYGWTGSGWNAGGLMAQNAERYGRNFDTYQDITVPSGTYELSVNGLFRSGWASNDWTAYQAQQTAHAENSNYIDPTLTAFLYATSSIGSYSVALPHASAGWVKTPYFSGQEESMVGPNIYIPNTMLAADTYFHTPKVDEQGNKYYPYNVSVMLKVGEDEKLRIGVKRDAGGTSPNGNWCCVDDFKLVYFGE